MSQLALHRLKRGAISRGMKYVSDGSLRSINRRAMGARQFHAASVLAASADEPEAKEVDTTSWFRFFQNPEDYGFETDAPYPIWFMNPHGPLYPKVLNIAQTIADHLTTVHDTVGLPWWATIVAGTLAIRLAAIPISIGALRNASRMQDAQPDLQVLNKAFSKALARLGPSPSLSDRFELYKNMLQGARAALHKHGCYPWRTLVAPFAQFPMLMLGMMGVRHMVFMGDESFEQEGLLWFPDLTVVDQTYALQVIAFSLTYLASEIAFRPYAGRVVGSSSIMHQWLVVKLKSGLQMFTLFSIPWAINLPAGIFVGWISSVALSLGWITMIRTPSVYKAITGREPPRVGEESGQELFNVEIVKENDSEASSSEGNGGSATAGGLSQTSSGRSDLHPLSIEDLENLIRERNIQSPSAALLLNRNKGSNDDDEGSGSGNSSSGGGGGAASGGSGSGSSGGGSSTGAKAAGTIGRHRMVAQRKEHFLHKVYGRIGSLWARLTRPKDAAFRRSPPLNPKRVVVRSKTAPEAHTADQWGYSSNAQADGHWRTRLLGKVSPEEWQAASPPVGRTLNRSFLRNTWQQQSQQPPLQNPPTHAVLDLRRPLAEGHPNPFMFQLKTEGLPQKPEFIAGDNHSVFVRSRQPEQDVQVRGGNAIGPARSNPPDYLNAYPMKRYVSVPGVTFPDTEQLAKQEIHMENMRREEERLRRARREMRKRAKKPSMLAASGETAAAQQTEDISGGVSTGSGSGGGMASGSGVSWSGPEEPTSDDEGWAEVGGVSDAETDQHEAWEDMGDEAEDPVLVGPWKQLDSLGMQLVPMRPPQAAVPSLGSLIQHMDDGGYVEGLSPSHMREERQEEEEDLDIAFELQKIAASCQHEDLWWGSTKLNKKLAHEARVAAGKDSVDADGDPMWSLKEENEFKRTMEQDPNWFARSVTSAKTMCLVMPGRNGGLTPSSLPVPDDVLDRLGSRRAPRMSWSKKE